jgi:Na+/proline symporter
LLAIVFSAAMSSTAGQISGLSSASMVDFYKRVFAKNKSDKHYVKAAKLNTVLWGVLGIVFALLADKAENLIQAVNILGSLFYGTILGIFVCGFFIKKIKSNAVFYSAIISEIIVIVMFFTTDIGFLWFNIIGCVLVVVISVLINTFYKK